MKKVAIVLGVIGVILITIGVVLQLIKNDCGSKTIKEYFESDVCRYVDNNRNKES